MNQLRQLYALSFGELCNARLLRRRATADFSRGFQPTEKASDCARRVATLEVLTGRRNGNPPTILNAESSAESKVSDWRGDSSVATRRRHLYRAFRGLKPTAKVSRRSATKREHLHYGRYLAVLLCLFFSLPAFAQTKLTGQVVCSNCWSEADRSKVAYGTQADLDCAKTCAAKGIGASLAVKGEKDWTLYELEPGAFKKPGKDWLAFMAQQVEITGATRKAGDKQFVQVDALTTLGNANALANQEAAKLIGTEAELALKDLFGAEQKLSSYRGRLVLVNFWATWCGPCVKEMPELAALQNEYAAYGLQVVGATADTAETIKEVRAFIKTAKLNFPVWMGATTQDMARFGLGPALPGTVLIGRDGKIVAIFNGVITAAEVKKKLAALIAQANQEAEKQVAKTADFSTVPS